MSQKQSELPLAETAYAKINLALHVRGRRDDGYHILDTIFAFLDDGDYLHVIPSSTLNLEITGPYAASLSDTQDNLVFRTARLLQDRFEIHDGAVITLDKHLPVASGIGGGSADAAAAARLLCKLWELPVTMEELGILLAPLGADIPACVMSKTIRGVGTGTNLFAIDGRDVSGLSALLVNPNIAVATGDVFARWSGNDKGALNGNTAMEMMGSGGNDLQEPALSICPEIGDILSVLQQQQPMLSRMSGSGATCFALFHDAEESQLAEQKIRSLHPSYWVMSGKIR
jgi:4-diphosphocytidyl-2-C-methyl-D-erythritol kinase